MGVVPGEYSTGGKQKVLGISKLGNKYLRRLFVRARAAYCNSDTSRLPF
jgi:transposase